MMKLWIHGYKLELTCFACPQQFDVYDPEGTQVGYIRIRHGTIRCHCPDYGGDIVYECKTLGDGELMESEELLQLNICIENIQHWLIKEAYKPLYD